MLKLCLKDFRASRRWWLLFLAAYCLNWAYPLEQNIGFMAFTLALAAACLATTMYQDYLTQTEILYGSLPLTRAQIVRGRYLLAGLLALGAGAFGFGYGLCLQSGLRFRLVHLDFGALGSLEGLTGYVLTVAFLTGLYFPFYYRLGTGRGSFAFLLVLLASAAGLAGLFGSGLMGDLFAGSGKDTGLRILSALARIREGLGTIPFAALGLGLAVLITGFSLRLSIRFYSRSDL
jgi:hypothetical protein